MLEKPWDLCERSEQFAVAVIRFCRTLPGSPEAQEMARQLRRSASSAAANYRSARRGKSHADFAAKLGTAIEESDEALFWLNLLVRVELTKADAVRTLTCEANELVAVFTACQKTARRKR